MAAGKPSASTPGLGCELGGHDQIDRHYHLAIEASALESLFPDPGLAREHEAGRCHGVTEEGTVGQSAGIDDEISVGGERLIRRKPAFTAQVHGLGSDQHNRVDVGL